MGSLNRRLCSSAGHGVPQDFDEARKWYLKAAEQGDANAQSNLGVMYLRGQGVPQDYVEAARYFRMAAEQGHALAQNELGLRYDRGQGVPMDHAEAAKWYRKAAEQGFALTSAGVFSPEPGLYESGTPSAQGSPSQPAPNFDHDLSAEELDLLDGLNGVFSRGRGSFQVTIRNGTPWRLSGLAVSISWNALQAVENQSGLAAVELQLQESSTGMPGDVSVFVGEDLPFVPRQNHETV